MGKLSRPRFGSLQFYPRKRADKALPSVNWEVVESDSKGILGMIGYKAGMGTAIVKDDTKDSMTKGKKISIPVTILEVPNMKIYSVRFYKNGKVMKDVVVSNDRELKKKVKVSKEVKGNFDDIKEYDDIRVIAYSLAKQTSVKKTPDMIELGINADNKLDFVKEAVGREITFADVAVSGLADVRGLTKGKGFSGPVARFGITLRSHKAEKGVRRPGSIGPWHPARVTFRTPMAGQLGMFTRVHYNLLVLSKGKIAEKDINKKEGFKNYGKVRSNYIILSGSVQGPVKRQILITPAMRPNKKNTKKKYEFLELK
jgi:large subunit ribosomal protein L3